MAEPRGPTPAPPRQQPERPAGSAATDAALAASVHRRLIFLGLSVLALLIVGVTSVFVKNSPVPESLSVVVLPFEDLSPQKDHAYFTVGVTDELIDTLSRAPAMRVVASASSFAIESRTKDIREIGRQLNVNSVLEGSAQVDGGQLRMTARLNRVPDGTQLWSKNYAVPFSDVFKVEHDIAQSVAERLRGGAVPGVLPPANLDAYRELQEGRFFLNQNNRGGSLNQGIEHFQKAIALDSNFAPAYAGLSDAYAAQSEMLLRSPKQSMPLAKQAAERGVRLDDKNAEAHIALGRVRLEYDWDLEAGQNECRRALDLKPGSASAHYWYARSLAAQSQLDEAIREMRVALDLDPLSIAVNSELGNELLWGKHYDEAIEQLRKAVALFPDAAMLHFELAETYFAKRDAQAGRQAVDGLRRAVERADLSHQPLGMGFLAWADALQGQAEEARNKLNALAALNDGYVEGYLPFLACSALSDRAGMAQWMQRMHDERSRFFIYAAMRKELYAGMPEIEAIARQR